MYKGKITKYFNIIPTKVTRVRLNSTGYNYLAITWNKDKEISGYEVYIYNSITKDYDRLGVTAENSCTINNLKEKTLYSFKVRAYKVIEGKKYYGEYSSVCTVSTKTRTDISKCSVSGIQNKPYTGSGITQNITVKYGNNTLRNGTDYIVSYLNNRNTGKANIIITGKGDYKGSVTKTFIITPKKVTGLKVKSQKTDQIKLSWSKATGVKGYKLYSYNYKKEKWEYVGKTSNTSYKVKGLKPGTTYKYRVRAYIEINRVQFVGEYSSSVKTGTKTKTPSISKLTTKSKKATIKWKKISGATGYELYMATSKSGKYSRIKTVTKASTTSYTKTKLKKNKKYYFKIRAYKTVDGKKIYSSYSSIKSIKIK